MGRTSPSNSQVLPNGCVVPLGPGAEQEDVRDSTLLYNEYIVYNLAQVNVKYLFQLKFVYEKRRRWVRIDVGWLFNLYYLLTISYAY